MDSNRQALVLLFATTLCVLAAGCAGTLKGGPGATVPWTRYEAENARSNEKAPEASRAYLTPESEAAGRRLARLKKAGDFLEFGVARPANGMVLRYGLPDSEDGAGVEATISLYVNGAFQRKLELTSRYCWHYGDFPWTNQPSAGRGHHFFDECQTLLPQLASGDVIRLQVDEDDKVGLLLVDFIELEEVPPPLPQPAGSLSITDFGGMPDDGKDDAEAFLKCVEAARQQKRIVWIPAGVFSLGGSFKGMGGVDVQGAGMWHSRLTGNGAMFYGLGERFSVSDLAIFGEVTHRNDMSPDNAFNGNLGKGSQLNRVWIEHMKCGVWTTHGTESFHMTGCRVRNTMADGVNLCDGTTDSVVEQTHLRNTGDDALATWSPSGDWSSKQICKRNRFLHNTIESPWHANGIGLYGGEDHEVRGNLVVDTVTSGGGLLISSGHGAIPFRGEIRVEDNRFIRTGGDCYVDGKNGGLWIHAHDSDIEARLTIRNLEALNSAHAAITIHGPRAIRNATLEHIRIAGPQERGIYLLPSAGEVNLRASDLTIERTAINETPAP